MSLLAASYLALGAQAQSFRFVHVTDMHVTASEKPEANAAKDSALLKEITGLAPTPAFVINTGDMTESGSDAEFATYNKTLKNLTLPHYQSAGNHDIRWSSRGKEGFAESTKQALYQSWDHNGVHFVLLDSTMMLSHLGHLDADMLEWLKLDLKKAGRDVPVVIGFHHWIGKDSIMIDNESELIDITRPYNIKLWLQGHGHSDQVWNVNGSPAVMSRGLYQGSYHLIEIGKGRLKVFRRSDKNVAGLFEEIVSVPLAREVTPKWPMASEFAGGAVRVNVSQGGLPLASTIQYRIDGGPYKPLEKANAGWRASHLVADMAPGEHSVTVRAQLPDGRAYLKSAPVRVLGAVGLTPIWSRDLKGAVQSRLVRSGAMVVATTMRGEVVAMDSGTGAEKWRFKAGGPIFSTPHVTGSSVYFGSADRNVYSLSAATGKLRWKASADSPVLASPAFAKGVLTVASSSGSIYGFTAATGVKAWQAKADGMFQSKPATDGDNFYVAGWDNYVRCLDALSGQERWKAKLGRSFYFAPAIASPVVGDGKLFVCSNDGVLHALEANSGKVLWQYDGKKVAYSTPLYKSGTVYVSLGDEGRVFALNALTGALDWQASVRGLVYDSSFSMSGGTLFIGSVNGTLSALRADDGAMQWQYRLGPGHLLASPATDDDSVYIASMDGALIALPSVPVTTRRS